MREIRQSGSEGGAESSSAPTPITEPGGSLMLRAAVAIRR